jgi:hypothetical protein
MKVTVWDTRNNSMELDTSEIMSLRLNPGRSYGDGDLLIIEPYARRRAYQFPTINSEDLARQLEAAGDEFIGARDSAGCTMLVRVDVIESVVVNEPRGKVSDGTLFLRSGVATSRIPLANAAELSAQLVERGFGVSSTHKFYPRRGASLS